MNSVPTTSNQLSRSLPHGLKLAATAMLVLFSAALAFAQGPSAQPATPSAQPVTEEAPQVAASMGAVSIQGTITDGQGGLIAKASLSLRNVTTGRTYTSTTDAQGHYAAAVPAGTYVVTATVPGFGAITKSGIVASATQPADASFKLQIAAATAEVTVDADATGSVAAALAPMDALLSERSARTEITTAMIQNFMSPIADYGEAVQMAPSTFTTSADGVGLGQSKTTFRGFPDGDYDIDFDGIPFYDTNSPTHHSWAFFPSQMIGSIDFDRSPGTASTIGPTPFGGSIHLLSKDLSPIDNIRATFSGGSFNTYLYDAAYDSGSFGPGHKFNLTADVHHMQSHGYQSLNNQNQNAGDIKVEYKVNNKLTLTGFSGVIWVDANTPNFSATRCQMYGPTVDSCIISGTTLYPYTGSGINFLLTNNSDPLLYLDTQYNYYHVPTDFEYVGVHAELPKGFVFDIKPYTYNYDNSEKYSNVTTMTELTSASFPLTAQSPKGTYLGLPVAPCNVPVTKKGVTAIPCGVDKYNSYRKYGETSELSQVSKYGTFNIGLWYEWANTNRHQYPSDPLTHWSDQALPNFAEKFVTNSYQPYIEYQWHATKSLNVTAGVKLSYYTISTQQFADDGKTIGGLGTNNPASFITNAGSYFATLPSIDANYRIKSNWSVYGQIAQGSIVPPSSVFDFNQSPTGAIAPAVTLPKQQLNTTYQVGTVLKMKRFTFDADYFHIYFDNSYSCVASISTSTDDNVCSVQPASVTTGVEGEGNIYFGAGLSLYLNASYDSATYTGSLSEACVAGTTGCTSTTPSLLETAPSGLNVASVPSDIETYGLTYQRKAWDGGFFDKRIGTQYQDVSGYHNQYKVQPFNLANLFLNYTLRTGGRFDQTKFRVSVNNLFNSSAITGITFNNGVTGASIAANGTTYTDAFNPLAPVVLSGQDAISILAARSVMLTVTFGLSPKHKN